MKKTKTRTRKLLLPAALIGLSAPVFADYGWTGVYENPMCHITMEPSDGTWSWADANALLLNHYPECQGQSFNWTCSSGSVSCNWPDFTTGCYCF